MGLMFLVEWSLKVIKVGKGVGWKVRIMARFEGIDSGEWEPKG
jgi:hypothetical protein